MPSPEALERALGYVAVFTVSLTWIVVVAMLATLRYVTWTNLPLVLFLALTGFGAELGRRYFLAERRREMVASTMEQS